jgi:hypothetical protein
VDAVLGVYLDQHMHMVRHDLKFDDLRARLVGHLPQDRFETIIHAVDEDRPPVLRAPDDMILAGVDDVSVALVGHRTIIQQVNK